MRNRTASSCWAQERQDQNSSTSKRPRPKCLRRGRGDSKPVQQQNHRLDESGLSGQNSGYACEERKGPDLHPSGYYSLPGFCDGQQRLHLAGKILPAETVYHLILKRSTAHARRVGRGHPQKSVAWSQRFEAGCRTENSEFWIGTGEEDKGSLKKARNFIN